MRGPRLHTGLQLLAGSQARAELYVQAFPGPHGHSHLSLHGASHYEDKLVPLGNHRQKQRPLYQRKVVPYALVLARPEGDVRKVVVRSFSLGRETLRLEAGRTRPEIRVPVDVVNADQGPRASWDFAAVKRCWSYNPTDEGRHRRVKSQRLLQNLSGVMKVGKVGRSRRAFTEHRIQLGLERLDRLGMLGEQEARPGQRVCRGLVSCGKDRLDLV